MLNIILYQENANENHDEILMHICHDDETPRRLMIANVGKDKEQLELSHMQCATDTNTLETMWPYLSQLNVHLPLHLAILLLSGK